jgi:hypothetical protein
VSDGWKQGRRKKVDRKFMLRYNTQLASRIPLSQRKLDFGGGFGEEMGWWWGGGG